jgi:hypothetical protein
MTKYYLDEKTNLVYKILSFSCDDKRSYTRIIYRRLTNTEIEHLTRFNPFKRNRSEKWTLVYSIPVYAKEINEGELFIECL